MRKTMYNVFGPSTIYPVLNTFYTAFIFLYPMYDLNTGIIFPQFLIMSSLQQVSSVLLAAPLHLLA